MKRLIEIIGVSIAIFVLIGLFAQHVQAQAQIVSEQDAFECTQLSIDKVDEALLTKAERLALMDKNLKTSMDQYEQCVSNVQQQMAGANGGGGQGSGQGGGESSGGDGSGDGSSENTSNKAGDEQENSNEQASSQSRQTSTSQQASQSNSSTNRPRGLVKPKDNDSIICQLLWEEIQNAPADKVDGFKKQYRDYKCG